MLAGCSADAGQELGGADEGSDTTARALESAAVRPRTGSHSGARFVAMRDGVTLDTHVFLPSGVRRVPTLLVRTPYPTDAAEQTFKPFLSQGYALVVQSCRGTGRSHGVLDPLAQ